MRGPATKKTGRGSSRGASPASGHALPAFARITHARLQGVATSTPWSLLQGGRHRRWRAPLGTTLCHTGCSSKAKRAWRGHPAACRYPGAGGRRRAATGYRHPLSRRGVCVVGDGSVVLGPPRVFPMRGPRPSGEPKYPNFSCHASPTTEPPRRVPTFLWLAVRMPMPGG